ncbi:MAG: hypothetical protein AAF495_17120 [Pseudomonadota bacterium]
MKRRRSFPWLLMGLLALCAGLGWLAYDRLHAAPQAIADVAPDAKVDQSVTELPATPTFNLPPASRFSAISERPLFSQTRRPPDVAAVETTSEVAAVDLGVTLQGIVVAGPNQIAIFKDAATGEMLRLKRNDRFKGWQLSQVTGAGVVFSNNDREQRLELDYEQTPPPQAQRKRNQRVNAQRQQQIQQQLQQQQQQQPVAQQLQESGVVPDDGQQD